MKMKRPFCIFISLLIIMGLCSCGSTKREDNIIEELVASGTTENDIELTEFEKFLENEKLELWMNPNTTHWYVLNKETGKKWYSYQPNSGQTAADQALFSFTYLNEQNLQKTMNTTENSIAGGQYTYEVNADTLIVSYGVGEYGLQSIVPLALAEERYQAILRSIEDEFDQGTFESSYNYVDINTVTDTTLKNSYLSSYPLLKEQPLYVVNSLSISGSSMNRLESILQESGYTKEQYAEDSKYFAASAEDDDAAAFGITVEYSLDGADLKVSVPGEKIYMSSKFPMISLKVLPYFASPSQGDSGYYLLADGSGALMNFYNGKDFYPPLALKVYGDNDAVYAEEKIYDTESMYLPYFGIRNGEEGILAELCDGAAVATVNAYTGSTLQPACTYASYSLYDTAQSSYLTEGTESYTIVTTKRYEGDISLRYTFLKKHESDFNQMAGICRQRIFGEEKTSTATEIPVLVQAIGSTAKEISLCGISYKKDVVLTTFAQAAEMMEYFEQQGISNMSLQLQGSFDGGYYQKFVAGDNKPLKCLGGEEAFRSLISRMNELDIDFYPDFDVQYVYQTGFADGFSAKNDTVTLVNRSKGYVYTYDPATFQKENKIYAHILNLTGIKKSFSGVARVLDDMELKAVSLRRVGKALNANYNSKSIEDRQTTLDETVSQVKKLAENNIQIVTEGANAPYLTYLSGCINLPLSSSGYSMTDCDVPFLQMVLNGNVDNYGSPLNKDGDFQKSLLQSAVTAAGIQVCLVGCSVDELKDIEVADLFAADYGYYHTEYAAAIKDYQSRMSDVAGREMTSYRLLSEGVHYSEFANGKAVIVNMTEQPYKCENGLTVGAEAFEVTEVLK